MFKLLLLSFLINAQNTKIAIFDSGIDLKTLNDYNICNNGLHDFTGTGLNDTNGHGTNIAKIIKKYNRNNNVCYMFIKIFNDNQSTSTISAKAFLFAIENKVDIINYSGGGYGYDSLENKAVNLFLKNGGILFAAVGNNSKNLNIRCDYFPACYSKDVFSVSNNEVYSNKYNKSLKVEYDGEKNSNFHGTSQSTAWTTAAFLNYLNGFK